MNDKVQQCSACGSLIVFMQQKPTVKNPYPKPNPINRYPSENGNLIVSWETLTYQVVSAKDLPKAQEMKMVLHSSHFATCEFKEKFRKNK